MRFPVVVVFTVVLVGCGGGQEERKSRFREPVTAFSIFGNQSPLVGAAARARAQVPAAAASAASQPARAVATSDEAVFTVEDEAGRKADSFELRSIRGKGFPELKLMLQARRIGETSPPEPVRPSCKDAARCEYRLTRNYTVALSDDKAVQLVPRDEGIAVVARTISVDVPETVEVLFSVDNRVVSRRRVLLLAD